MLKAKKLFLLDLDGTIYLDECLFPCTLPFLGAVRANGARAMYLTNNSSKSVDAYLEKFVRLGIPATADDFVTSTDATIRHIEAHESEKLFYVLGTESFRRQLSAAGIATTTDRDADGIGGLIMGFDTELTFRKLEDASILLRRPEIVYLASHPDTVCPTSYGAVPDCGAVASMLESATGRRPYFIGKPRPEMLLLALERAGVCPEDAVMIGDRLHTDIASGNNAGIDTVLVLSGESTREDVARSPYTPTYILSDLSEIYR
jgi:HAD superfamily hydrolase (TIGR01450 family)